MNRNLIWIFILITQCVYVACRPIQDTATQKTGQEHSYNPDKYDASDNSNEQVISVRITSSVAVGRGREKSTQKSKFNNDFKNENPPSLPTTNIEDNDKQEPSPDLPPHLLGANIEYLKQITAKKDRESNCAPHSSDNKISRNQHYNNEGMQVTDSTNDNSKDYTTTIEVTTSTTTPGQIENNRFNPSLLNEALKLSEERLNPNLPEESQTTHDTSTDSEFTATFTMGYKENSFRIETNNETDDSVAESSIKSVLEIVNGNEDNFENIENIPLARSLLQSPSSKNYIQGFTNKPPSEREPSTRLTTVSFNVVHDPPNIQSTYNDPNKSYLNPSQSFAEQQKMYEAQKFYSRPSQVYSEPAKFYSEPSKIYSEPAKVYSEPAKIYSEPAKIYSEPAKFYSEPASLHLGPNVNQNYLPWQQRSQAPTNTRNTTPITTISITDYTNTANPRRMIEHQPEKNYEVDEKLSVLSNGRSHGVQETSTEKCKQDNCKVGYVVKGREYNKYRVEERTSDGFLVGEYGVVRNEDGALRGVRYTADSEASPRLIYDALMKFLQLK